jgi:hypothetical protein
MHLETIGFGATAPGTSGAAASAFSGDSLTLKNARPGSRILALAHFADHQTAGFQQIVFPSGHDTTRGYRAAIAASEVQNLLPYGIPIPLQAQELLSITIAGSATAGDIEQGALLVWYEDSPFISANLITHDTLAQRFVRTTTVYATIATGTSGGYSGAEAINAESDLLRANTDYAIIGMTVDVEGLLLGIRAPDFSGQRVSIPANPGMTEVTANWFPMLSRSFGVPCIPVFNSANRANVLLDAAQDENGADLVVGLILAQLS